jgi:hypothetical protein
LNYYTIADWRKNGKPSTKEPDPATDTEQKARIRELEPENNELRQANCCLADYLRKYQSH